MRVVSLPFSLNAVSGVICLPIGNRKTLEKLEVKDLVRKANGFLNAVGVCLTLELLNAHPEPVDPPILGYRGGGR